MSRPALSHLIVPLLCLSLCCPPANAGLPDLGDPTLDTISSRQERLLGKAFYRSLRANLNFIDDLPLSHYLNTLGNRLASHSDAAGKTFHFFVIDAPTINAFAGPAAYIGVHSKLLLSAANESELAGVLAHEIAHVSQRHLARQIDSGAGSPAVTLASIIAAILIGARDFQAGQAVLLTGIAGSQQASINFIRNNEYEADRVGLEILRSSGINPLGMVGFFETLLARDSGEGFEYLRTHPLNTKRIVESRNRVRPGDETLPSNSLDFQLAQARIAALTTSQPAKLAQQTPPGDDIGAQYRRALALIRVRQPRSAITILQPLADRHLWLKLALAEAYTASEEDTRALSLLTRLTELYPDYLPVTLLYARALLRHEQPEAAITVLKRQLQVKTALHTLDRSLLYGALARAYFANGQIAAALEATGNQYVEQGYFELAISQYDNALEQKSISESTRQRLQTGKRLIQAQMAELKDIF